MKNIQVPMSSARTPDTTTDLTLSSLLAVSAVIGLLTNALSCIYFISTRNSSQKPNSRYVKLLFSMISAVDVVICALQVPVIHNLYNARNSSAHMFPDPVFRKVWTATWKGFTTTSVFLIAQLSASRLALLARPHTQLRLKLLCLPALMFSTIVLLVLLPNLTQKIVVEFLPGYHVIPGLFGTTKGVDLHTLLQSKKPVPRALLLNDEINNIMWACIAGLPLIPISVLCVASVIYLKRAKQRAKSQKMQHHQHTHATTTIVCATILYILCNLPSLGYLVNRLYRTQQLGESPNLRQVSRTLNPSAFEKFYFTLLLICCSVLNSNLNPALYLWRMSSFRTFMKRAVGMSDRRKTKSARSSLRSAQSVTTEKFGSVMSNSSCSKNTGVNGESLSDTPETADKKEEPQGIMTRF
jgi:hypothetical protein